MKNIIKTTCFLFLASFALAQNYEIETENSTPEPYPFEPLFQPARYVTQVINSFGKMPADFQVNESINRCDHYLSRIAVNMYGRTVVVWYDERNGKKDVFCQRYDEFDQPLGVNFKVNEVAGSSASYYADVDINANGDFVIVWQEYDGVQNDIYLQRFNQKGEKIGPNTLVNDDATNLNQYHPKVTLDNSGRYTVVWEDTRHSLWQQYDWDIYLQRFQSDGKPIGSNQQVNDDEGRHYLYYPDIYTGEGGEMAITWEDRRNGQRDIYLQRYSNAGSPLGTNIKVNDDSGTKEQWDPAVAIDGSGKITVCWEDDRNPTKDIYFQRFDKNGNPLGSNTQANDQPGGVGCYNPGIVAHGNGNFVIVWYDRRQGNRNIYAQRFDGEGKRLHQNFRVNEERLCEHYLPQIDIDDAENFTITWYDTRHQSRDIFYNKFNKYGHPLGQSVMVNDDEGSSWQQFPTVAVNPNGEFIITWQDKRNAIFDIFAQRYDSLQQPQGTNFMVNSSDLKGDRQNPGVAMNAQGEFVVCWNTYLIGGSDSGDIYCQRFNRSGTAIGAVTRVNDDPEGERQFRSRVAIDPAGNFVVLWTDLRNLHWDAFFQRFDFNGNALGPNTMVLADNPHSYLQGEPAIAMASNGNFIITWSDDRYESDTRDIMLQRFQFDGALLGENIKVNDDTGKNQQNFPQIAADSAGNFIVAWEDNRNGNLDIYCQFFNSDGTRLSANQKVNDDAGTADQINVAVTMDKTGNVVIIWQDRRDGQPAIYGQRYSRLNRAKGANFNAEIACQHTPDLKLRQGFIYYTWDDTRFPGHGFDVFGRVARFNNTPEAPLPIAPANNSFTTNTKPTLTFTVPADLDAGDSLHFKVEVATDNQFTRPINGSPFESQKSSPGFAPTPPLLPGPGQCSFSFRTDLSEGIYHWRVAATDGCEYGAFSPAYCLRIDLNPPFTAEHNPPKYAQNVPVNSDVVVHVKDAASGVDSASVVMKVNGNIVTTAISGVDTNYTVTYNPPSDFNYNQTVNITVDARDYAGRPLVTDSYYFFTQADLTPPYTSDHSPAKYAQNVPVNTNIVFHLKDAISGVDATTIVLKVNGVPVSPQTSGTPKDLTVTYDPPVDFDFNATIAVAIEAADLAGNPMNPESYNFTTSSNPNQAPAPPILTAPANGSQLTHNKPVFSWNVPTDVNDDSLHFVAEIAHDSNFTRQVFGSPFKSQSSITGFNPPPPLPAGSGECHFTLPYLLEDGDYWWRITATDGQLEAVSEVRTFSIHYGGVSRVTGGIPEEFVLFNNYPNPFNPRTTITFGLPRPAQVLIEIFDVNGRLVTTLLDHHFSAGTYSHPWMAKDAAGNPLTSGIYICRMKTGQFVLERKLLLLR